jgi:hypothetical protein
VIAAAVVALVGLRKSAVDRAATASTSRPVPVAPRCLTFAPDEKIAGGEPEPAAV